MSTMSTIKTRFPYRLYLKNTVNKLFKITIVYLC
nr:MAG TPA: hypothetical protein [Caudoviricetes sp.]